MLGNRITKGSLKGTMTLNDEAFESRLLKVISAYVMQDDLFFPMLNVEDHLLLMLLHIMGMGMEEVRPFAVAPFLAP